MRRALTITLAVFLAVTALASCAASAKFYSVFFLVTVDSAGKISSLQVVQVRDVKGPGSGPVNVTVPESYVAAARAFLSESTYRGPNQFVTYTFFDPTQPSRADINPRAERQ
jgi:hypothetical protein